MRNRVITGKTARDFSKKMMSPDRQIMEKKNAYIANAKANVHVEHKPDGKVVLQKRSISG